MAAFVAACRAEVLSERTIEFYLEGLNSYGAFAGADERDLTLADLDLDTGRAWLADFVERGRKPATVVARARALRVFSHRIVTDDYVRADPLEKLKVPKVPTTIVETFSTLQILDLIDAAPKPLALVLEIFYDTGIRLEETVKLRNSDVGADGHLRVRGKGQGAVGTVREGPRREAPPLHHARPA